MKLNHKFLAGLVSIGLLAIVPDSAFASGRGGGHFHYFSAGNPGGIPAGPVYPLTPTPANQAWVNNNAWAKYLGQVRQGANVSSGSSVPTLQQNGTR
jgi:hypothetical protein